MRRALRALSTVLIVAGTLLLVDAGLTLVWQEPVSALYAQVRQGALSGELDDLQRSGPTAGEQRVLASLSQRPSRDLDRRRLAFLARSYKRRVDGGTAVARVRIPRLGLEQVVVDGTDPDDLRTGPGLFPGQPWPGARGTAAIAGHRTTYGAPFRRIDRLRRGDRVVVEMPYGRFTYRVRGSRIVVPTDLSVLRRRERDALVLTACHPLYSAEKRIVVVAELAEAVARTGVQSSDAPA